MLTRTLGKGLNKELFEKCFLCKDGVSYYMTKHFLTERINRDKLLANGVLDELDFLPVIQINGQEGFVLEHPKQMPELAQRLRCDLDQLYRKTPEKMLSLTGIEKLRKHAVAELGLAEDDVCPFTTQILKSKRAKFCDALQLLVRGTAKYIFCNDEKQLHTNLVSYCQVEDQKYFFIWDSQGYSFKSAPEERKLTSKTTATVIVARDLVNLQIEVLSCFNSFNIVISTETRHYGLSSCSSFAREDLRSLNQNPGLHVEILSQARPVPGNPKLLIFTKFPAQMLLLLQTPPRLLSSDPRSKQIVVDRDGERGPLGELLLRKHYDQVKGLNMYSRNLIEEFLASVDKPARLLPGPTGVCSAQQRLTTPPAMASFSYLSIAEELNANDRGAHIQGGIAMLTAALQAAQSSVDVLQLLLDSGATPPAEQQR